MRNVCRWYPSIRRPASLTAPALAVALALAGCGRSAGEPTVQIAGYTLDVKGGGPSLPAGLAAANGGGAPEKWIVQLSGPVHESEKQALRDLGVRIGDYVPDFAFVVTMDAASHGKVVRLPFVRGAIRYHPAFKIQPSLKDASGNVRVPRDATPRILHVRLDGADAQPAALSEVYRRHGRVHEVDGDVVRIELAPAEIAALAQREDVLWIEGAVQPEILNDTTRWVIQSDVTGSTPLFDRGLHGEGQIVGVADTGLDHDMPWFLDPAGIAPGPNHRKVIGYDATYGDDYDANEPGHGTHVSGTVAGDRTPVDGLSTANGMAPKARLFVSDITPGSSGYVFPPADLGLLFAKAYDAGARIHTNSWGANDNSYSTMSMTADRYLWDHKDLVVTFANGNAGSAEHTVGSPATAKDVVSVGATLNGAGAESVTWFSSKGPTADGRLKPTVCAPGDGATDGAGIVSADSDGVKNSGNSGTRTMRGTSMATPAVAGAAALVRQYFTEGRYPSGAPTPADAIAPSAALVKAALVNSARNMTGAQVVAPFPATGQGWGRVTLADTLTFLGDGSGLVVADETAGLATDGTWTRTVFPSGGRPLKVTLAWTDYPGAAGATKALVNDLDLSVTAPDGTTYLGNVFQSGASAGGGAADRLNVEEQVLVAAPASGPYTVTVRAYNVPNGPQPFAVVINGASAVTSKGVVTLDRRFYRTPASAVVTVYDRDLDANPDLAETVTVHATSAAEPAGETVTLTETGPHSGIFRGTLPLRIAAPVPADGELQGSDGGTVTVTYSDANDGSGAPATAVASATVDGTAPGIGQVSAGPVTDTTARITWTTTEPADSTAVYGPSAPSVSVYDRNLVTTHAVDLTGLVEARTYRYLVASSDAAGNSTTDDAGGSFYWFTTARVPPTLTVTSSNGAETTQDATVVFGTTRDASGIASVTVNGAAATYRATDGHYELSLPLFVGDNVITVVSTDTLGTPAVSSITVRRLAAPDFTVSAVSSAPVVEIGKTLTVSDTTANLGPGNALQPIEVGYYLSPTPTPGTAGYRIGTRSNVGPLAAGASSSGSVTLTIPANVPPGTYHLVAYADPGNSWFEASESNNGLVGNQVRVMGADLTVTAVSGPPTAKTGDVIAITDTVANDPNGAAAPGFYVYLYLSRNGTSLDYYVGQRWVPGLAAGASSTGTTNVTVPLGTSGSYALVAVADVGNRVAESNEDNNVLAGGPLAVTAPDLLPTAVSGPASAKTGDTISITDTVTADANGGVAGGFYVYLYLSRNGTSLDYYVGQRWVSGLAPGASSTGTTSATVPLGTSGVYSYVAVVDVGNRVPESNEGNNTLAGGQLTVAAPDLVPTAVSGPANAKAGDTIAISDTVTANANGGVAGGFYVYLYLSRNGTSLDYYVGQRWVSGLAAGASSIGTTSATVPLGTSGVFSYVAVADVGNRVPESNEGNNTLAGGQLTVGAPDLLPTAVSGPSSAKTGDTIAITDTVTADANGGVAGGFYVYLYLSRNGTSLDYYVGQRWVSGLAPGASSSATTNVTVPLGMSGVYSYVAVADVGNRVPESNEGNNTLAGGQVTVSAPDLVPTAVSGPASAKTGDTIAITDTVTADSNGGVAGGFYVYLYLSRNGTSLDYYVGQRWVPGLAAGASSTATTNVTVPLGMSGVYSYVAVADVGNRVPESNEGNNTLAGGQLTVSAPDLVPTAVSGPASAKTGDTIAITDTVTADSNGGVAGGFYVYLYLSRNGTSLDYYVGQRWVPGLAAGASSTATTNVTVPLGMSGVYSYVAVVDVGNRVPESNEGNNTLAGGQLTVAAPDLVPTAVSGPATAKPGDTIAISNTVTADANGGVAGGFYVYLYLSRNGTSLDYYVGQRWVTGLAPGAPSAASTSVVVPATLTAASYFPMAVVDVGNRVPESNEGNNTLAGAAIPIAP